MQEMQVHCFGEWKPDCAPCILTHWGPGPKAFLLIMTSTILSNNRTLLVYKLCVYVCDEADATFVILIEEFNDFIINLIVTGENLI